MTEKLRKALIAYGNQLSRTIPSLTFSVGVSEINDRDQAIEDILARADRAQYLAKTTGKAVTRTDIDLISEAETNAQSTVDEPTQ